MPGLIFPGRELMCPLGEGIWEDWELKKKPQQNPSTQKNPWWDSGRILETATSSPHKHFTAALPALRTVLSPHCVLQTKMNLWATNSASINFSFLYYALEMLILFNQSEQGWLSTKLLLLSWGLL